MLGYVVGHRVENVDRLKSIMICEFRIDPKSISNNEMIPLKKFISPQHQYTSSRSNLSWIRNQAWRRTQDYHENSEPPRQRWNSHRPRPCGSQQWYQTMSWVSHDDECTSPKSGGVGSIARVCFAKLSSWDRGGLPSIPSYVNMDVIFSPDVRPAILWIDPTGVLLGSHVTPNLQAWINSLNWDTGCHHASNWILEFNEIPESIRTRDLLYVHAAHTITLLATLT